jgi:hypothetical protein
MYFRDLKSPQSSTQWHAKCHVFFMFVYEALLQSRVEAVWQALAAEPLVGFFKNLPQYFQRMSRCGECHSTPFRMEFLPPTVSQTSNVIHAISQSSNQD